MKRVVFTLSLWASPFVFCLGLLALISGDPDPQVFPADMPRAEVYRIMGPPLNTDPQIVAVWHCDAQAPRDRTWRGLLGTGQDGIVAIFGPDDRTLLHSYAYSATTMDTTMSDSYVLTWARDQREESMSPAQK